MNKTWEQQLNAIYSRLRFIQRKVWDMDKSEERDEINNTVQQLKDQLEAMFGPKIARDIFWKVKEK